jgi:hypothetical protein
LKVGFKLMKQGHNFGRVLEAVSPTVRGNVEKYMRKIDWGQLTSECKNLFDKTIAAFIDGLDSWLVKVIAGRNEVKMVIEELKALQKSGSKMIDAAFAELKSMHAKMMGHELPRSTAAVGGTSVPRTQLTPVQAARAERKLAAKRSADARANRAAPNSTTTSTKKKAQQKKQKWRSGIPAEHITDYFVKKKHVNFKKANNAGRLTEEWSTPHNGIDHLWSNKASAIKPFVVGETKSSIFDSFKLMAALPADLRQKFETLRADEAATPTRNGQPNIFHSENRDRLANGRIAVGSKKEDEDALKRGLNRPNEDTGLRTQMSHKWIKNAAVNESLTPTGRSFLINLRDFEDGEIPCPYQRWISLVTGRQLHKHQKSKGAAHEIQTVLNIPDSILDK